MAREPAPRTSAGADAAYEFDAVLWRWDARPSEVWTLVSLPPEVADEVLDRAGPTERGFGALRVEVRLGSTLWRTSLFPDNTSRTYVLPIKKAVRAAEGLGIGDSARFAVRLLDV